MKNVSPYIQMDKAVYKTKISVRLILLPPCKIWQATNYINKYLLVSASVLFQKVLLQQKKFLSFAESIGKKNTVGIFKDKAKYLPLVRPMFISGFMADQQSSIPVCYFI